MKVKTGDVITVHSRLDQKPATVKVTGLFKPDRATDAFWHGDKLVLEGVEKLDYTTFGPLVVDPATFHRVFAPNGAFARWTVQPEVSAIGSGEVHGIAVGLRPLELGLKEYGFSVATAFPELLGQLDTALLVTRSTMLVPILQLIVLAGYALLLVARLIAEQRRTEVALLRARGASLPQLSVLAISEGLLIALPGVLLAPLAAPPLLRLAAETPVLRASGVQLDAPPTGLMWAVASAAALASALALAAPTVHAARSTYVDSQSGRGRGAARGPLQRAGADLALLVVAGLGLWQLTRYGSTVTATSGGLGIDPFIVTGPALALLAGGALLLRLIPVVSGAVEKFTARGRGFAPALGARQVSRRPLRYAGPALLLVMAVAVGVLSVTTSGTWRTSQIAQADFQAGADLRVEAPAAASAPSVLGQGALLSRLPGVRATSPVLISQVSVAGEEATLMAGDAATLPRIITGAPDAAAALGPLAAARRRPAGELPGAPKTLAITWSAAVRGTVQPADRRATMTASIVDALGLSREVDVGEATVNGGRQTSQVPLTALAGPGGQIAYPLAVQGLHVGYSGFLAARRFDIRLFAITGDGTPMKIPPGSAWQMSYESQTSVAVPTAGNAGDGVELTVPEPEEEQGFEFVPNREPNTLHAMLGGVSGNEEPVPAVLTSELAARKGLAVGSTMTLTLNGREQPVKVVGLVKALPGTPAELGGVLLDLPSVNQQAVGRNEATLNPSEWWLAGDSRAVAALAGWPGEVVDRQALRREYRDSPLGAALQGALLLGFLAALSFAVIGFAINATVSARERVGEFAILRALGAAHRQIFGLLAVEQALLILVGLLGGLVLGLTVADLVVPRMVLTVRATVPYPAVQLVVAWRPVLVLLTVVLALLATVLGLLVARLRRTGATALSRIGADT